MAGFSADRTNMDKSVEYLKKKKKVLFLTTSTRWSKEAQGEKPKSTLLAQAMAEKIGEDKVTVLDVPSLNIFPCEGNVSTERGNTCGVAKALLKDPEKNPTGYHRCWASINNPSDELWKISKELFASDAVVFFGSVRWGQMNSFYQKLIERLTWIENRHSTFGEPNVIKDIDAGIVAIGHNWNGQWVVQMEKQVLEYFGFRVVEDLCWNWQYTKVAEDESDATYKAAAKAFKETFLT